MADIRDIDIAVEQFANNHEFVRLYNRHNRELLLQHFLLIAAAGDEVWRANQERKMSMQEQRDQMLIKYMEWLDKMATEFPEVEKPFDVSDDWWRLMLLAYERKPISGKSLWRKFKEDTRNPILSSFNCHWGEPREGESLEDRFRAVRRGVWRDLGHRDDEFLPEGSWLPKQWYAWRYCCYPGKNCRAFDGKLPSVNLNALNRQRMLQMGGSPSSLGGIAGVSWAAALPIDTGMSVMDSMSGASSMQGASRMHPSASSAGSSSHQAGNPVGSQLVGNQGGANAMRVSRSTLPTTAANHRLLSAAASMSRARGVPEDELSVQQYLADVQQYMAQMTRLEKAATLAEAYGEHDKAAGFKRQLYEHVQTEPPVRLKRVASAAGTSNSGNSGASLGDSPGQSVGNAVGSSAAGFINSSGLHSMSMTHLSSATGANSTQSSGMMSASLPIPGSPEASLAPPLHVFANAVSGSVHHNNNSNINNNNNHGNSVNNGNNNMNQSQNQSSGAMMGDGEDEGILHRHNINT